MTSFKIATSTGEKDLGNMMEENVNRINTIDEELAEKMSYISVKNFGAKGDGVTDDTVAINNALASGQNGDTVYLEIGKTYIITGTIHIPQGVNFDGNMSALQTGSACNFTNNYMVAVNSDDVANWKVQYPLQGYKVKNLFLDNYNSNKNGANPNVPLVFGIFNAANYDFERIYSHWVDSTITTSNNYLDHVYYTDCECWHPRNSLYYPFHTGFLGDDRKMIRLCALYPEYSTELLLLYVAHGHNGVIIDGCINGQIYILGSNVSIRNIHNEIGSLIIQGGIVSVENSFFYISGSGAKIQISGHNFGTANIVSHVKLKNVIFAIPKTLTDYNAAMDMSCISLDTLSTLQIDDVYKYVQGQNIGDKFYSGVEIQGLSKFNKYSTVYSKHCIIGLNNIIETPISLGFTNSTNMGINQASDSAIAPYRGADGTYYYKAMFFIDADRQLGTNATFSIFKINKTRTKGGASTLFWLSETFNVGRATGFFRIYRGSADGVYTQYVDVPINSVILVDDGVTVNGWKWLDLGGMTEITAVNININVLKYSDIDKSFRFKGSVIPTSGTWATGDIIENDVPNASGYMGWVYGFSKSIKDPLLNKSSKDV